MEIKNRESRRGVVTNRREDRLQKHPERFPGYAGSEHHQPEAKKPVDLTTGSGPNMPTSTPLYPNAKIMDTPSERSWKSQRGQQKPSMPYPRSSRVPSAFWRSQLRRRRGEVIGSRKKLEPKVPEEGEVVQRRGHGGGKREWCAGERREQKGSRV
jgi:hypothetical protein